MGAPKQKVSGLHSGINGNWRCSALVLELSFALDGKWDSGSQLSVLRTLYSRCGRVGPPNFWSAEKRPPTNHPTFQQGRVPLRLRFTKLRQKAYPTVRKMGRPPSKKCRSCIVVASMEIDDIFKENLIQKTNPKMFPQDIVCTAGNGESGPLFPINWG